VIVYPELGKRGRLGNQLWEIASTLGLGATHGQAVRFPDWSYRPQFRIPGRYFASGSEVRGVDATTLAPHIAERHRPYLQDASLWLHIEPTIRRYFAPSAGLRQQLQQKFADFMGLGPKTAVHVRRTDYVTDRGRFPPLPGAYYRAAIERSAGTHLVVFSDDLAWCRRHLAWARPTMFMDGNADYEDLFLMASCDHHVIANSSFSWWGAYLSADRSPIFPTRWYGPVYADIDATLMYLDGWIGLDARGVQRWGRR
jgi:hypothetical protein